MWASARAALAAPSDTVHTFTSKRAPWWRDGRQYPEHLFIPDTQIKPGVPIEHVRWAAEYALERKPDVIVLAMDWWDFPSLNSHEEGHADFRTRDLIADLCAGRHGWDLFFTTLRRDRKYDPLVVATLGNHERRFDRTFLYDNRMARGLPSPTWFVKRTPGVKAIPFLEIACVDGIHYCHYFAQPLTGKAIGGTAINKLNKLKFTYTQGHVQTKETAEQHLANRKVVRGLVMGAFYQHDEDYKGPQGNAHWRGVAYKHEVRDGNYDLMEVSMDYLRRRFGGKQVLADGGWKKDEITYEEEA